MQTVAHAAVVFRVDCALPQDKVTVKDDLKVVPFGPVAYKTPYNVETGKTWVGVAFAGSRHTGVH